MVLLAPVKQIASINGELKKLYQISYEQRLRSDR